MKLEEEARKAGDDWLDAHTNWIRELTEDEKIGELRNQLKGCLSISSVLVKALLKKYEKSEDECMCRKGFRGE